MIPPWYCHECSHERYKEWQKDREPTSSVSIHHNARMRVIRAAMEMLERGHAVEDELEEAVAEYKRLNKFFDGQYGGR